MEFIPLPAPRKPQKGEYSHPKFGKPDHFYAYRDVHGALVGYVCRWDLPDGRKEVRPLRYGVYRGRTGYHWKGWQGDAKRPLYGLDKLASSEPGTRVLLSEGEK